jgi:hypothetical protein
VLERGSRELESRATALYSEARQEGNWQAIFTDDQINGWLAVQLAEHYPSDMPGRIRDPRVAIAPNLLTLGFRASSGGVDTVVSVEAGVFLTDEGAVAIRLMSVHAGSLPLPVMQLADEITAACQRLSLPVRWTRHNGKPLAIVEVHSDVSAKDRQFYIDAIELAEDELYVAGHTDVCGNNDALSARASGHVETDREPFALGEFELRLTPRSKRSALEVARRGKEYRTDDQDSIGN